MFAMRGKTGELRRGYRVAARLGSWTWDGGGSVTAPSPALDSFWIDEADAGPLSLRLDVGSQQWTWHDVQLAQREPLVIAVTGKPERR
jgi:hypothetical protein